MNEKKHPLIAIDIAKDTLQVQSADQSYGLSNNHTGHQKLRKGLRKMDRPFVVCEATGGYERALLAALHEAQIAVCLINPARVRAFATSEGVRAKTDKIDAKVLLRFAQQKDLRPMAPPTPEQQQMTALLDRRQHLSEQLAREKNRLQNSPKIIHCSIQRMIGCVKNEIEDLDQQLRKLIHENDLLRAKAQLLTSVKGVGEVTTWTLLAYLSEMTDLKRSRMVALAGLAPYNRDRGKSHAKRSIKGGRAKVRKCLYMAARTAAQHNPVIKPYVQRLVDRGMPYQCALVAAMRKLLIHLQSLLKNHQSALAS